MSKTAEVMDPDLVAGAHMGTDAGNLIAQGVTLMRVENESMLAVAIQRPRDEKKVLKAAIEELLMVPEEAKRAYYSIPYRERQMDGSTKLVQVEGPSIKASMALARRWGNCSVTARSLSEDAAGSDLAGIFMDFETNFRVERPMRVSRVMKKRSGGTYTLDPQRWLAALQAGASKAARNATINGLPAYLVAAYMKQARTIAAGDPESKADPKKIAGVVAAFKRYEVSQEMLETYLETKVDNWMGDDLATLIGLGNAIKDGQITVAEAFDLVASEPAAPATATTGVTAESVTGGATTAVDGANPGQASGCSHPKVPPSSLAPGTVSACPDCGEELRGPRREPPPQSAAPSSETPHPADQVGAEKEPGGLRPAIEPEADVNTAAGNPFIRGAEKARDRKKTLSE